MRPIDADILRSDTEYFIGKMMMFGGEEIYTQTTIDKAPTLDAYRRPSRRRNTAGR